MLEDIRGLFQGKLSYTQIIVMGISGLYRLAQEVRKQTDDPDERTVLFEHIRITRDITVANDAEWNLNVLRDVWQSHRQEEYQEQITKAAEFLRQGRQLEDQQLNGRGGEVEEQGSAEVRSGGDKS
jgi:hypothetical protein